MSSSSGVPEPGWVSAFCGLIGHEYFAEVSEDFIEDDFNLTGLQSQVPMYKEALEMILDVEPEDDLSDEDDDPDDEDPSDDDASMRDDPHYARRAERRHMRMASDISVIESSAEMLYGLIHQRFITSRQGIQQMAEKYEMGHFGHCPRVFCGGARVLPVGCSDIPGQETVKLFCPACLDVYTPPNSRFQSVDGAFFGTTFGCLFFMSFPEFDVGGKQVVVSVSASLDMQPPLESSSVAHKRRSSLTNFSNPTASSPRLPQTQTPLPPQPTSINGINTHNLAPGLGPGNIYEPRIYGFRVSELAKSGPRMKWLRSRPLDMNELDEVAIWERAAAATKAAAAAKNPGSSAPGQAQDRLGIQGHDHGAGNGGVEGDDSEDMDAQDEEEPSGTALSRAQKMDAEEDEEEEEEEEDEDQDEDARLERQAQGEDAQMTGAGEAETGAGSRRSSTKKGRRRTGADEHIEGGGARVG